MKFLVSSHTHLDSESEEDEDAGLRQQLCPPGGILWPLLSWEELEIAHAEHFGSHIYNDDQVAHWWKDKLSLAIINSPNTWGKLTLSINASFTKEEYSHALFTCYWRNKCNLGEYSDVLRDVGDHWLFWKHAYGHGQWVMRPYDHPGKSRLEQLFEDMFIGHWVCLICHDRSCKSPSLLGWPTTYEPKKCPGCKNIQSLIWETNVVAKAMRFSVAARHLPQFGMFGNGMHPLFAASLKEHVKYDELWRCRPIVGIVDLTKEESYKQKIGHPISFNVDSDLHTDVWFAHEFRMDEVAYSWDLDIIDTRDETLQIQMEISSYMAGWPCSNQPETFQERARTYLYLEYEEKSKDAFKFQNLPLYFWSQLRISADKFDVK